MDRLCARRNVVQMARNNRNYHTVPPVNPLRSRRFAEAIGVLAKNNRVDAAMLARYDLLDGLEGTPPPSRNLLLFCDLLALRRKLVEQFKALRKLRDELDPELRAGADPADDELRDAIADCDGRMRRCIAADAALARRAAIVESIPGFGPVNAACLCADMPELGRLDRRQAASLFDIAPFDADSGSHCGPRRPAHAALHGRHHRDPLRSRMQGPLRAPRRSPQVQHGRRPRRHAPAGDPAHGCCARTGTGNRKPRPGPWPVEAAA